MASFACAAHGVCLIQVNGAAAIFRAEQAPVPEEFIKDEQALSRGNLYNPMPDIRSG
jgi:hypothetical protein